MNKLLSTLVLTAALSIPLFADTAVPVSTGTADIKFGTTVLTFSDTVATGLDTAEVVFKKAQPARINPGKGTLTFVASGGAIDLANAKTEIINSGGVIMTKGEATVTLLDPIVELSEASAEPTVAKISATVVVNGASQGRKDLFNISGTVLTAPVIVPHNRKITAKDLNVTLTSEAATALNTALGITVFTSDTAAGTVDISVKLGSSNL
jgi:hypothetical protein